MTTPILRHIDAEREMALRVGLPTSRILVGPFDLKYAPSQPRDAHGRFSRTGGGGLQGGVAALADVAARRADHTKPSIHREQRAALLDEHPELRPLADASDAWIGHVGSFAQHGGIKRAAEIAVTTGKAPVHYRAGTSHDVADERELRQHTEHARSMLQAIQVADRVDKPLHRGLTLHNDIQRKAIDRFLTEGATFDEVLATWTSDKALAGRFAAGQYHFGGGRDATAVRLTVRKAKAVPISPLASDANPREVLAADEHVTGGRFRVTKVTKSTDPDVDYDIDVEHVATINAAHLPGGADVTVEGKAKKPGDIPALDPSEFVFDLDLPVASFNDPPDQVATLVDPIGAKTDRWPAGTSGGRGGEFKPGPSSGPSADGGTAGKATLVSSEDAYSIFDGFQHGDMRTEVRNAFHNPKDDTTVVDGAILAHHQEVGHFQRAFDPADRSVMHMELFIDKPWQGRGFASAFNAHAEGEYARRGYTKIELQAGGTAGGIVWAKSGYNWRAGVGPPRRVTSAIGEWAAGRLPIHNRDLHPDGRRGADSPVRKQAQTARDRIDRGDPPTPAEVLDIGRGYEGTSGLTVGERLLLDVGWQGEKQVRVPALAGKAEFLDPDTEVTMVLVVPPMPDADDVDLKTLPEAIDGKHMPGRHDQMSHGGHRNAEGIRITLEGGRSIYHARDVDEAARLLGEGKHVRLGQPRELSTLIDKLGQIGADAAAKGEKAPNYNLAKVSVKGTNVFFTGTGPRLPRVAMPQLSGRPLPGTRAASLPRDALGGVNLGPRFAEHLQSRGFRVTAGTEKAAYLRASQGELDGVRVAGIAKRMREGSLPYDEHALFVSSDNYVVDGHHRWAARVGNDFADGRATDRIDVQRIDAPILDVLGEAHSFAQDWGMEPQDKTALPEALGLKGRPDQPRRPAGSPQGGQFAPAGGGGGGSAGKPDVKLRADVGSWEREKPWDATKEDVVLGRVDGIVHRAKQYGSEVASYLPDGRIATSDAYFDLPSETRRAVLYHEAGHGLESAYTLDNFRDVGVDDPIAIMDMPGASKLHPSNYSEVLAEGYSALWSDPGWFDRQGATEVRDLVVRMAKHADFPLPTAEKAVLPEALDLKFSPSQPRRPAGSSQGGQFAPAGGGGSAAAPAVDPKRVAAWAQQPTATVRKHLARTDLHPKDRAELEAGLAKRLGKPKPAWEPGQRPALTDSQKAALAPKPGGWTTKTREQTVKALKETDEGRTLLKTVDSFQSGSRKAIPLLRTDIEKALGGGELDPGRRKAVDVLLGAIKHHDGPDKSLYRGMTIPGTREAVEAHFKSQSHLDVSVGSFTTDHGMAINFAIESAGQRVSAKQRTAVMVTVSGKAKALPIENLAKSGVFANEKEWLSSGRFRVNSVSSYRNAAGFDWVEVDVTQEETW
jgi:hypothetical protein